MMNKTKALRALAALAQDTRLEAFRLLVQAGEDGMTAGDLATRLAVSPPSLSFHMKGLAQAGLVQARQAGRFVHYTAAYEAMQSLVDFLGENCCGGAPCKAAQSTPRRRAG